MPLDGVYAFPHGALSLVPGQYPFYKGLEQINKSCFSLANEIYSKSPETIYLITPHGISLETHFGIYLNNSAKGSACWKGAYNDFTFEGIIDSEISKNLLFYLQKNGNKAEGIVSYSEDEPIPLRWGEVIPLWFISQAYANNSVEPKAFPKLVIISMPRKRNLMISCCEKGKVALGNESNIVNNLNSKQITYGSENKDGIEFIKECHKFGKNFGEFCSEYKKKFVIVVSGDLAHKHIYPSPSETNIDDKMTFLNLITKNDFNNNINNYHIQKKFNLNNLNKIISYEKMDQIENINTYPKNTNTENENTQFNQKSENYNQNVNSLDKSSKKIKLINQDNAELLDFAIKEWFSNPIVNEQLLISALEYQKKFLSCGYFGYVIMLGFIKEFSDIFEVIKGEVLSYCHPTYYGMMVAKLILKEFSDYVLIKN